MITSIAIPKLTLTMEGGTLVRWLKREGDLVQKDEVLFEIETDKANAEVPSPATGTLKKILIQEGPVAVGATVGFIGEAQDALAETVPSATGDSKTNTTMEISAESSPAVGSDESTVIRATPAARRRARESGLELAAITGTGPEGRITQEDVEAAIASRAEASAKTTNAPSDFRSIIAERTLQAWHAVPHIHVGGELQAGGLKAAIDRARARGPAGITITDLLLLATASALPSFPCLNSVWSNSRAEPRTEVNLGFAVHTDRGVVIPVIQRAERRSLPEISSERRRLKEAVLNRSLQPRDLEGGTFTLSNLGMFPVDFFAPIVNYPQCAILATGRLRKEASAAAGTPPGWSMWANVALDHRVADGAVAAGLLAKLENIIAGLASLDF